MRVDLSAEQSSSRIVWICRGLKQGRYHLDVCCLETPSLLGLWSVRTRVPLDAEVRIYPNLYAEQRLMASRMMPTAGMHTHRQLGKGREFDHLREYILGDCYEDIHWKATAKRRVPVTKIYQIEQMQEIYLIIDASRLSARNAETFSRAGKPVKEDPVRSRTTILDRYITASLMMGLAAERQGDLFGIVTFSDRVRGFLRAKNGKAHYNACRDALYTLEPQNVSPDFTELFTFMATRIRRRALLLFLTNLDDPLPAETFTNHIRLLTRQHLVVVSMLRPATARPLFSSDGVTSINDLYTHLGGHLLWVSLREREKVLQKQGIGFYLLDREHLASQLISRYLNIKRRQIL